MQKINIITHGSTFSTRERARDVVAKIALLPGHDGEDVYVDFAGVRAISYSFADEFVRAIKEEMARLKLTTIHLIGGESAVQAVFQQILDRRQVADKQQHGLGRHDDTTILVGAA